MTNFYALFLSTIFVCICLKYDSAFSFKKELRGRNWLLLKLAKIDDKSNKITIIKKRIN